MLLVILQDLPVSHLDYSSLVSHLTPAHPHKTSGSLSLLLLTYGVAHPSHRLLTYTAHPSHKVSCRHLNILFGSKLYSFTVCGSFAILHDCPQCLFA